MVSEHKEILSESFYRAPDDWAGRVEIFPYAEGKYHVYVQLSGEQASTVMDRASLERLRDGLTSFLERTKVRSSHGTGTD